MPTEWLVWAKISGLIYTTKLKKCLLEEFLIIVTDDARLGNFLKQSIFSFPTIAK